MALRFIDSFDHYDNSTIYKKWTNKSVGVTNLLVPGRHGNAMNPGSGGAINKTLTHQSGWVVGVAYRLNDDRSSQATDIIAFLHVGTTIASLQLNPDSTLALYAGQPSNAHRIGITSGPSGTLSPGVYYYLEVKVAFGGGSNIAVTASLRINGATQIGSNTVNSDINNSQLLLATTTTNVIQLAGGVFDDLYVLDNIPTDVRGQAAFIDFLGDVKAGALFTNGDIVTTWTPAGTSHANHYQYTNENPPDDDTSYLFTQNVGNIERFDFQDIPAFSGTIVGVQYLAYCRKDDEGSRSIKQMIGDQEELSPVILLSDQYNYYMMARENDPATNSPWTQSGFNSKSFGVIVVANP